MRAVFCHAENAACVQLIFALKMFPKSIQIVYRTARSELPWMRVAKNADVGAASNDEDAHRRQIHGSFNEKVEPDCGEEEYAQMATL